VLHWIETVRASGGTPYLATYPSSALALCNAASAAATSLEGLQLSLRGEPIVKSCLDALESAGVQASPLYGTTECGTISQGCLRPVLADEGHLLTDLHAVIQAEGSGTPEGALFVTSLRPTARLLLLNASMGDSGTLDQRRCGCPLEDLGWLTHLSGVRSFQKLSVAGMTFFDVEVARIVEEELPLRLGGNAADYQLVEAAGPDGRSLLRLIVHPRIGEIDSHLITTTFLQALARGSDANRMMVSVLRDAPVVEVVRDQPRATPSGKVLPIQFDRPAK
jgi:hypothetical protein